jgi:hypothetical protein
MGPESIRFGGGPTATLLHPLVAVVMVVALVLILSLRRQYIMIPMLLSLLLIPRDQQLVLAGLHLNVYRILILAGLARWVMAGRWSQLAGGFNFMDRICIALFVSYFLTVSLLFMDTQATIKNTGDLMDALGGYLVMRFLIRDREDIVRTLKVFVVIALVNAVCMVNEQRTGIDFFAKLAGMDGLSAVRDGKIRSQGAFGQFLTAGSFSSSLVPLLIWLWTRTKSKISAIGILAATVMTVTSGASTTEIGYAAAIGGLCLWPIRKHMRLVRWGIVVALLGLHLVMNGPVWSLLEHIDLTGSSSSYHRYQLIDNFVRHFGDWWFLGSKVYASWGWMMWDTSNQYVTYAFTGGLLPFALFVAVIVKSFSRIGIARKRVEGNRSEEWFFWCLGASMLCHVICYLGSAYWDQVEFAWFAFLAIISAAVFEVMGSAVPKAEEALTPSYGRFMQVAKQ